MGNVMRLQYNVEYVTKYIIQIQYNTIWPQRYIHPTIDNQSSNTRLIYYYWSNLLIICLHPISFLSFFYDQIYFFTIFPFKFSF